MRTNGNTIFITGGSSGIGRGLAAAFHGAGNRVIVAGRREDRLKDLCSAHPGMRYFVLDVRDTGAVRAAAHEVAAEFPELNCVVNNAGMQNRLDFSSGHPVDDQAVLDEVNTNLLGVLRITSAFLPHLRQRQNAVIVNVSSGLAFVPLARFPIYCATKAAVHSFTLSLRQQLRETGVRVIELAPPYVATELGGPGKTVAPGGPAPMPLAVFIAEAMKELATEADEICIGDARHLAAAACAEKVRQTFAGMNRG